MIVGRWNRAILTPAGVAERVFGLEKTEEVSVLVPHLHRISPFIVRDPKGEISVSTEETRLLIRVENTSDECLEKAMRYGLNVLKSLPLTPVSAAGLNVNYVCDGVSPESATLVAGELDKLLAKISPNVVGRVVGRSLEFRSGQLNLTLGMEGTHLRCSAISIGRQPRSRISKEWWQRPSTEVRRVIDELLTTFGLYIEEFHDASD